MLPINYYIAASGNKARRFSSREVARIPKEDATMGHTFITSGIHTSCSKCFLDKVYFDTKPGFRIPCEEFRKKGIIR